MDAPAKDRTGGPTAPPLAEEASGPPLPFQRWRYPETGSGRDERLDLMRGFAMCGLIAVHVEVFSLLNLVFWEGLGFVTSAELFVATSGLVLGVVQRRVVEKHGLGISGRRLLARAFELYRAYVALILLVALVAAAGLLDTRAVTTFTDWCAGQTYPLYPPPEAPWFQDVGAALLLRATPHQVQVLGLYVCLIALTPVALWLLANRFLGVLLALSWIAYFAYWAAAPVTVTGAQFEYAFPLVVWQLLFAHALAVGYHRPEVARWLADPLLRRLVVAASIVLSLGFLLLAHSNPWAAFPSWYRLELVPPEVFERWHKLYFLKNEQGVLRLVNIAVFFAAFYALLTRFWRPLGRALGWLLVPIGQNSLYAFLVHVPFIVAIDNLTGGLLSRHQPVYDPLTVLPYTLLHLGVVLGLWLLIKRQVLFSLIPR